MLKRWRPVLLQTRKRRYLSISLLVALVASLSACGADQVEVRAREKALELLQDNVATTMRCLDSLASRLEPSARGEDLADELSECVDISVLNRDDDYIRLGDYELPLGNETIGVSVVTSRDDITMVLATQGIGSSEAGVATARVTLTTCWQVEANLAEDVLEGASAAVCSDALLERIMPTERVPFSDLSLP